MSKDSFLYPTLLVIVCGLLLCTGARAADANRLRVMTYNTYYVFDKGKEEAAGIEWIKSRNPDVVALQELTDIQPEKLQQLATAWGHEHSSLLKTNGYSVGLSSRWKIDVIEKRKDGMHHGYLHAKTHGVHYFVIHLSPFKWEVRLAEAEILMAKIGPLLDINEKVVVLGDFNAVSPNDRSMLAAQDGLLERKRASDMEHDHVTNLKQGEIDFSVLEFFFDGGLQDPGLPFFKEQAGFIATIPTGIWSEDKNMPPTTGERIDFILTGPRMAAAVVSGRIDRDGVVNRISDHYPVTLDLLMEPLL